MIQQLKFFMIVNGRNYDMDEYAHEYRETLKAMHKCTYCRQQDARTLIGKPLCFDCLEKKRIKAKNYNQSASQKKSRTKALQKGLCTQCLKRKPSPGFATCNYCREKFKEYYYSKRLESGKVKRSEAKEYGLCSLCLTNPRYKNYNTCESCYNYVVNKFKGTQSTNVISKRITNEIHLRECNYDV